MLVQYMCVVVCLYVRYMPDCVKMAKCSIMLTIAQGLCFSDGKDLQQGAPNAGWVG